MYVYLDHASLVPPVTEALDAMRSAAESFWGQPGSLHGIGARARYALDQARQEVAEYVGTLAHEIVFAANGRDALRRALELALERAPANASIVSSRLEHPSVQVLVEQATRSGRAVHWLKLPAGVPSEEDLMTLRAADLVALSICNHEMGTVLDLASVAPHAVRVIDAVQAAPWVSLEGLNDARTFYALSGSKLGAPMSVGVLRVPSDVHYAALADGLQLEGDSPPWMTAVGLGAACAKRAPLREQALETARQLANRLLQGLRAIEPTLLLNGDEGARLGPIVNVSFPGRFGKSLVSALSLEKICISHTAACQARHSEMSPVVRAAYPDTLARAEGATRWSVSERVTEDEIDHALETTRKILARMRN
ncbi:aminotransferase class V-fold PLP-dependent enzyme [Pendulispora rubella]|uniref:Aminotransferase class V-fold PLP-dependent enzyme n=1 Tax=Pendulispora rubella TaxID=2741070 RepID=A0ABZ2LFR9_9BACT